MLCRRNIIACKREGTDRSETALGGLGVPGTSRLLCQMPVGLVPKGFCGFGLAESRNWPCGRKTVHTDSGRGIRDKQLFVVVGEQSSLFCPTLVRWLWLLHQWVTKRDAVATVQVHVSGPRVFVRRLCSMKFGRRFLDRVLRNRRQSSQSDSTFSRWPCGSAYASCWLRSRKARFGIGRARRGPPGRRLEPLQHSFERQTWSC